MTCEETVFNTTCLGGFTQSAIGEEVDSIGTLLYRGKGSIPIMNLFSLFVVTLLLVISNHGIYTAFMLFWKRICPLIETMITDYGIRIHLLSLITKTDNLPLIESWKFSFSSIGFNYIIKIWIIGYLFKGFHWLGHHGIYIDYFMVGEHVRCLFTSCDESQTNERVFERVSLRFFTTSE